MFKFFKTIISALRCIDLHLDRIEERLDLIGAKFENANEQLYNLRKYAAAEDRREQKIAEEASETNAEMLVLLQAAKGKLVKAPATLQVLKPAIVPSAQLPDSKAKEIADTVSKMDESLCPVWPHTNRIRPGIARVCDIAKFFGVRGLDMSHALKAAGECPVYRTGSGNYYPVSPRALEAYKRILKFYNLL